MKMNYANFKLHDQERFTKYLEDVKKGKKKMNSTAVVTIAVWTNFVSFHMNL